MKAAMNQSVTPASPLEERLRQLEDVASIGRLKASYCAACDDDHNGVAVTELFVPGGTWATTLGTTCRGQDALREYFDSIRSSGRMRYSTHMVTNPVVDVSGDRARGSWSFMMMYTDRHDSRFRILGFYQDEFVRTVDGWRFQSLQSNVQDYVKLDTRDARSL